MGAECCQKEAPLKNKNGENFIMYVIESLKISQNSFDVTRKAFDDCLERKVIKEGNFETEIIKLEEAKFNKFISKYFYDDNKSNTFLKYHKSLAPTFEEITEKDFYEFNLHQYCLSLYNNNYGKEDILQILYKEYNSDFITIKNFKKFLREYLYINLITFTEKINTSLSGIETRYNKRMGRFLVNHELKENCRTLHLEIYNDSFISIYFEKFVKSLDQLIKEETGTPGIKINANFQLTSNILLRFFEKHYFLLDCLSLRNDYYKTFEHKIGKIF